jgi:hypothetical protein
MDGHDADSHALYIPPSLVFVCILHSFGLEVVMQIFWTIFALLLPSNPAKDAKRGQACGQEFQYVRLPQRSALPRSRPRMPQD